MQVEEHYNLTSQIGLVVNKRFIDDILSKEKENLTEENQAKIIIYGTSWCGGTSRARRVFEEENIEYEWVDIDRDEAAARFVESVANGFRSVPTIVFPDSSVLVEPSTYQLREKLGL